MRYSNGCKNPTRALACNKILTYELIHLQQHTSNQGVFYSLIQQVWFEIHHVIIKSPHILIGQFHLCLFNAINIFISSACFIFPRKTAICGNNIRISHRGQISTANHLEKYRRTDYTRRRITCFYRAKGSIIELLKASLRFRIWQIEVSHERGLQHGNTIIMR